MVFAQARMDRTTRRAGGSRVISLNDAFLGSAEILVPSDAVAALLVLADGRYVMQLRDTKPHIFYPGHWGLFGGAIDDGETEIEALTRELAEELEFEARELDRFVRLDFDLSVIGAGRVFRAVYVVPGERAGIPCV
jgi:8-oxo-dGTP pyrophosphatase MutT (NUDIX family)